MNKGLTLIEIIISIGILGFIIVPLMSMFILSAKINNESNVSYRSFLIAQKYIEEIKVLNEITDDFTYNISSNSYEKIVPQADNNLGARINIKSTQSYLYDIKVDVIDNGEIIYSLNGSKIIK